ncbi:MAG TPA: hypothetical protein VFS16_10320 [Acidimicrobiia bacterium]|nr:hypothetical protein [Acidimicrobiia bacterium]
MPRIRNLLIGLAVVAGAVVATGATHTADGRAADARKVVKAAAVRFPPEAIRDAWSRAEQGDTAALHAIRQGVGLAYRGTSGDGDAVVLSFQAEGGRCVDLVSGPDKNRVKTRDC